MILTALGFWYLSGHKAVYIRGSCVRLKSKSRLPTSEIVAAESEYALRHRFLQKSSQVLNLPTDLSVLCQHDNEFSAISSCEMNLCCWRPFFNAALKKFANWYSLSAICNRSTGKSASAARLSSYIPADEIAIASAEPDR